MLLGGDNMVHRSRVRVEPAGFPPERHVKGARPVSNRSRAFSLPLCGVPPLEPWPGIRILGLEVLT
jgi:hypothetical protein